MPPLNSILSDMATLLQTNNVAGLPGSGVDASTGWTLGLGFMTPDPDQMIGLFESGGMPNEQVAPLDRPTFQLRVRSGANLGYDTARTQLEAARAVIEAVNNQVIGSRRYVMIMLEGNAIPLGPDSNNRQEITMHFKALRSRST